MGYWNGRHQERMRVDETCQERRNCGNSSGGGGGARLLMALCYMRGVMLVNDQVFLFDRLITQATY